MGYGLLVAFGGRHVAHGGFDVAVAHEMLQFDGVAIVLQAVARAGGAQEVGIDGHACPFAQAFDQAGQVVTAHGLFAAAGAVGDEVFGGFMIWAGEQVILNGLAASFAKADIAAFLAFAQVYVDGATRLLEMNILYFDVYGLFRPHHCLVE